MTFKSPGVGPIALFREHMTVSPGSFSTSQSDSDLWVETARIDGTPARRNHLHDSTAYATAPTEDSWEARLSGKSGSGRMT